MHRMNVVDSTGRRHIIITNHVVCVSESDMPGHCVIHMSGGHEVVVEVIEHVTPDGSPVVDRSTLSDEDLEVLVARPHPDPAGTICKQLADRNEQDSLRRNVVLQVELRRQLANMAQEAAVHHAVSTGRLVTPGGAS